MTKLWHTAAVDTVPKLLNNTEVIGRLYRQLIRKNQQWPPFCGGHSMSPTKAAVRQGLWSVRLHLKARKPTLIKQIRACSLQGKVPTSHAWVHSMWMWLVTHLPISTSSSPVTTSAMHSSMCGHNPGKQLGDEGFGVGSMLIHWNVSPRTTQQMFWSLEEKLIWLGKAALTRFCSG